MNTAALHDINCPWQLDQYPHECTCGVSLKQVRARIAKLEAANDAAPGWGAAVGARCDEIRGLRSMERKLQQQLRPQGQERAAS